MPQNTKYLTQIFVFFVKKMNVILKYIKFTKYTNFEMPQNTKSGRIKISNSS